ncbi:hypothetical protein [Rhizobium sp. RU20A]|uniref:hypothetical protein n=1 Tax=Rhizobium sp. RU20A TaxID=1907412 RepID=UPI001FCEC643|nr:hypothetical protein [Rhizobium sp. RU20A]
MKRLMICTAAAAFLAGPVLAGPLADAAKKAEEQAAAGDVLGAHETLREAVSVFSANLPFTIGKAVFVTSDPKGYAMYTPKDAPVFKAGESLVSYVEPIGLTWKPAATAGQIETHFTVDFDILNPEGQVLASQKAFGDFTFTGYVRNQEIYSTLTIDVSGAPAGDYVVRYHFNDINGNRTASVDQKFTIAAAN